MDFSWQNSFLRALDICGINKTWTYFQELLRAEQGLPEQAQKRQWEKFKRLLDYAYYRVDFYKERFSWAGITPEDIQYPEDMGKIPVLKRSDCAVLGDSLRREKKLRCHAYISSSGTTGKEVRVFLSMDTVARRYALLLWYLHSMSV